MNKIWLIISREYLTRVRNRTFIITTLLVPLLIAGFFAGSTYLAIQNATEKLSVAVKDNSGVFKNNLKNTDDISFSFPDNVDTANYADKGYNALLLISSFNPDKKDNYSVYAKKSLKSASEADIEDKVNEAIENKLLMDKGIQKSELDSIHTHSQLATISTHTGGNNDSEDSRGVATAVGYFCGILVYITMLIYGMMVMRGVMEEKTNRIAEVIVSSVKPFQLMFGKIVGIGAVGLTQFLMWGVLIFALANVLPHFLSHDTIQNMQQAQQNGAMAGGGGAMSGAQSERAINSLQHYTGNLQIGLLIGCFIFYFLGGYLFYASLFAAIGSVVEDVQNSQSLTLPITMPIIFSFIIMTTAVQAPDSSLAVWASLIPFSSPIVMMARLAYGVPGTVSYIQLLSSMALLVAGFLFTTWLAGKIYRTGILLYGKKPSWGQMMKWAFRRA